MQAPARAPFWPSTLATTPRGEGETSEHAWLRHVEHVRAVPKEHEVLTKADLVALGGAVQAIVPRIQRYRTRVCALAGFDPTWFDELSSLAAALQWIAVETKVLGERRAPVAALRRAVAARRRDLVTIARAKAVLTGAPSVDAAVAMTGKRPSEFALSLQATIQVLRQLGLERTPLTEAELDAAHALAMELLLVNDPRQRELDGVGDRRELRRKALALLMGTYREVRMAVLYVGRREAGIEGIMPPLWKLRGERVGKRRVRGEGEEIA